MKEGVRVKRTNELGFWFYGGVEMKEVDIFCRFPKMPLGFLDHLGPKVYTLRVQNCLDQKTKLNYTK